MRPNDIQLTNVSTERSDDGVVTLNIEVAPAAVQAARTRVIKDFSKRIRVPGFRPGSAPAGIVRRNVGDEAIAQEVADQIIGAAYQAAVQQENVVPLEQAQVDQLTFDAFDGEKPLSFVARVIARPEITVGETDGLEATKKSVSISDADVDAALERMREEAAYLKNAPARPVEEGDVLFALVQVYVDGEARSEEPANLRGFVVGQSGFVPAIDEHLVGMNLDETKKFTVTYPDDFPEEDLREKEAEFEVTITAIKERVVPELTDEFAQIRQAQNVEDLKTQLRGFLATSAERESRREVREALVEQVVNGSQIQVPGALVQMRVGERVQSIEQELAQNGATMDAYLNSINSTREQLESDLREEIEGELKTELVLDEIASQQQFNVTQEEAINHYQLMANVTNTPPEELIKNVPYENVRSSILQRKAIDWLVEKSQVKDEEGNAISLSTPAMADEAEEALEDAEIEAAAALDEAENGGSEVEEISDVEENSTVADETSTESSTESEAPAGTAPSA